MSFHTGEEPEAVARERAADEHIPHAALDAVAAILRALAEAAAGEPDSAARLEAWTRHVLVLEPAPGSADPAPCERDWPGLGREVATHVRTDSASVSKSIGDLRDAVWLVIERLSQAIVSDAASDASAGSELETLRAAIDLPADELKATALATVQRLSEILDQKHARQVELARELAARVDVLSDQLADTRREADIDPLTRVCNRGVFQRELPRAVQKRTLLDEPACLILIDIDQFKQINDRHGHKAGDDALEVIAGALVRSFPRRSDVVARLGGDEFAVIAPGTSSLDGYRLASRLLDAVRELGADGERAVSFTVSAGLAEALVGEDPDAWFARADRALYEAKAEGRDRVFIAAGDEQPGAAAPATRG
jgi:diguanylate cyclase (GGDEF)-like protein